MEKAFKLVSTTTYSKLLTDHSTEMRAQTLAALAVPLTPETVQLVAKV